MENFLLPPDGVLSDSNPAATPPHELASVSRLPQIGQPVGRVMQLLIDAKRQTDLKVHEPGHEAFFVEQILARQKEPKSVDTPNTAVAAAAAPCLESLQPEDKSNVSRNKRKTLFQPGGLHDGVELNYVVKGEVLLRGKKEGEGILCDCCKKVVTCTEFEKHAGHSMFRNPYKRICTADGRSLYLLSNDLLNVGK